VDQSKGFLLRLIRAWRYWRRLHYSWRLAWAKAGSCDRGLQVSAADEGNAARRAAVADKPGAAPLQPAYSTFA